MINNLKKGYDCASILKDILERKQIIDNYHLTGYLVVNYEEAWMTLQIDAADALSSRMHDTLIVLLTECRDVDEYSLQPKALMA